MMVLWRGPAALAPNRMMRLQLRSLHKLQAVVAAAATGRGEPLEMARSARIEEGCRMATMASARVRCPSLSQT